MTLTANGRIRSSYRRRSVEYGGGGGGRRRRSCCGPGADDGDDDDDDGGDDDDDDDDDGIAPCRCSTVYKHDSASASSHVTAASNKASRMGEDANR